MKSIILIFLIFCGQAFAADSKENAINESDFDTLGNNRVLLDSARALEPEKKISIVQNRTVSMQNRVEIAPEFSGSFGGDTYSRTRSLGLNLQYHFNSRWSAGVKYNYAFNTLTPEGQARYSEAIDDYNNHPERPTSAFPQLDYPKSEILALVNWYPVYGKLNLLDKSVAHFDFYFVGGYGQTNLSSGATPTYTAGNGFGFWITNHFSTRLEMRYQTYSAKYISGDKKLDLAIASVQMGWLL